MLAFHDNYLLAHSLNWYEQKPSHITTPSFTKKADGYYLTLSLEDTKIPVSNCERTKCYFSFQTSDIVRVAALRFPKLGEYMERIAIECKSGNFYISTT